jgi:VanZ family protein
MTRPLRLLRLWQFLGLLGVCVLIQQSLTPSPAVEMEFSGGDKLLHFSAYATLMLWFGFIYLPGKAYLHIGAGLTLMGITMEILQGITDYRSFECTDLVCNFFGVTAGWLVARTRLSMALIHLERALARLKR